MQLNIVFFLLLFFFCIFFLCFLSFANKTYHEGVCLLYNLRTVCDLSVQFSSFISLLFFIFHISLIFCLNSLQLLLPAMEGVKSKRIFKAIFPNLIYCHTHLKWFVLQESKCISEFVINNRSEKNCIRPTKSFIIHFMLACAIYKDVIMA